MLPNPQDGSKKQQGLALVDDAGDGDASDEAEDAPKSRGKKKSAAKGKAGAKATTGVVGKPGKAVERDWPKTREEQAKAVAAALRDSDQAASPDELAKRFNRAPRDKVEELLAALATLGQARALRGGKYARS